MFQICDFGLAKWKQQAATQTVTGNLRGTVAYMAPEVFRDPSLPRTIKYDVYSFGILLWELLSGQKPFEAGRCCQIHLLKLDLLNTYKYVLSAYIHKAFVVYRLSVILAVVRLFP